MIDTPTPDESPSLWTFTLERYSRPGVQRSAISLQDNLGADVNLLFFCLWHAETGRGRLDATDFERVEIRIARWRDEVTLPLRSVRTIIRSDADLAGLRDAMDVRGKILAAEIESERVAQIVVESFARPPLISMDGSAWEIADRNLRSYLAYIDAELDEDTEQHLESFLNGAFS